LAVVTILGGGLRGAGDTRRPLVFTFIGFLSVRIPFCYLLALKSVRVPFSEVSIAGFGLGVFGAWYAMMADVVVRAVLFVARFLHGGWKRIDV
jgi:Na+-driven multidrug efflux pump